MSNQQDLRKEGIIREETVSYLKSKVSHLPGKLYLTGERLYLEAHNPTINEGGRFFGFLKKKVENSNQGFDLEFKRIVKVGRGKFTRLETLEITDDRHNTYRILVDGVGAWEREINQRRLQQC